MCVRGTAPLNFSCNQCQRRYSIADEKVRGKTVKIRCKNCQYVIS
ncbi:MAG: zinc-ribbon domain-containing protein, partial [Cystobacter sp.]